MELLAGVHRVQRVPVNDRRRHTSTITVAIVDDTSPRFVLDDDDCVVETYRGSGAGGQHRNTSDTAVRVRHVPSGVVVKSEAQRSWWRNKEAAFSELRRRLEAGAAAEAAAVMNDVRVGQIGVGDRPSHDWTWTGWRDEVVCHSAGARWRMAAALKGRFL